MSILSNISLIETKISDNKKKQTNLLKLYQIYIIISDIRAQWINCTISIWLNAKFKLVWFLHFRCCSIVCMVELLRQSESINGTFFKGFAKHFDWVRTAFLHWNCGQIIVITVKCDGVRAFQFTTVIYWRPKCIWFKRMKNPLKYPYQTMKLKWNVK